MYTVKSLINDPVDSVTYIVANEKNDKAIIIDPGTKEDRRITDYLEQSNLEPEYILLTHEHFDHILGVNYLREVYSEIKLVSSEKTSIRLPEIKKNLSVFHNQTYLVVAEADILVEEGRCFFSGLPVNVFHTPGHTDSSLSFAVGKSFFSGDFLLPSKRAVTNLPTGSRIAYQESIKRLKKHLMGFTIYPGHGNSYEFSKMSL